MNSRKSIFISSTGRPDPVPRVLSAAALMVAIAALIFSMNGMAPAAKTEAKEGKAQAKQTAALKEKINKLAAACPVSGAIDLGSWCLEGSTFKVPAAEAGQNDYFYAAQKCVKEGGWLPTAAQLIGAPPVAALKSTIDDD